MIHFLKQGRSIQEYFDRYCVNNRRRGRKAITLSDADIKHIHERDIIFPDMTKEFDHLEGDTIVGKNHEPRIITLAEKLYRPINHRIQACRN